MMTNIPIKKSKYLIDIYKENAPIFGEVLKGLEFEISNKKLRPKDISELFEQICRQTWSDVAFPFKNVKNDYGYFDKSICLSVNNVVAHGSYEEIDFFNSGDLVTLDCGISIPIKSRFEQSRLNFDSAFTTIYNKQAWLKSNRYELIQTNLACLALLDNKESKDTYSISTVIEETAINYGYGIVVDLVGHGIGLNLHEAPKIYNAKTKLRNVSLLDGLVLCIEPIYTLEEGFTKVFIDSDGWTIKTSNGTVSSHFETMYLVENNKLIDLVGISKWNI